MSGIELWDNLIQMAVSLFGGVWMLLCSRGPGRRSCLFLSLALQGWALGLLFHLIYLALRGYAAPPPNPSQFVWSGAHLFYISVIRSLNPGTSRGRPPRLAYLAPLLTLPFTLAWFFWDKEGSPLVNLLWGAGFAYIAFEILRSLLHSMQRGEAWAARYHAMVLLMILFDEMVLLSGLFYQRADFARMNAYYAFDFLVTLALLLQPVALHKAVSA